MSYFHEINVEELDELFEDYYRYFSREVKHWFQNPVDGYKMTSEQKKAILDLDLYFSKTERDYFIKSVEQLGYSDILTIWTDKDEIRIEGDDKFVAKPLLLTAAFNNELFRVYKDNQSWYYVDMMSQNKTFKCDDIKGLIEFLKYIEKE